MASRSTCKSQTSALVEMPLAARVSSAKLETNAVATSLSMSPMSTRNKSGPRTDPCGTPDCWHTLRTINNHCLFAVGQEGMYPSSQFPRYAHALQLFHCHKVIHFVKSLGKVYVNDIHIVPTFQESCDMIIVSY